MCAREVYNDIPLRDHFNHTILCTKSSPRSQRAVFCTRISTRRSSYIAVSPPVCEVIITLSISLAQTQLTKLSDPERQCNSRHAHCNAAWRSHACYQERLNTHHSSEVSSKGSSIVTSRQACVASNRHHSIAQHRGLSDCSTHDCTNDLRSSATLAPVNALCSVRAYSSDLACLQRRNEL